MNILLICPEFPETFWSFNYALSFVGKKAAFPPLGLLTVATLLPKDRTMTVAFLPLKDHFLIRCLSRITFGYFVSTQHGWTKLASHNEP